MLAENRESDTALIISDRRISFGELRAEVEAYKRKVANPPRAIVVLEADPSFEFVAALVALLESSLPVAITSKGWAPYERENRRNILGSACEFDPRNGSWGWTSLSDKSLHHPGTAMILFTSGSTGYPKAVQLSLSGIQANTSAVIDSLDFRLAKEQTLFLPLSYSFGLNGQLLPALHAGLCTTIIEQFLNLKQIFEGNLARGMWSGVPSHWEGLLRITEGMEDRTREITHVISAGAPLSVDLRKRLQARFSRAVIYNNYGMTEASPRVLSFSSRHPGFFEGGAGIPVGDWETRLTEEGELILRGAQTMLGYLGDETGTLSRIREGWLHSGDHAAIEEDGRVSVLGRVDELFKIGGERTSPVEIEVALKRLQGVQDAGVYAEEDPILGTKILAYLVTNPDFSIRGAFAELPSFLPKNKFPREFYKIDALPLKANGKIDRQALPALKVPQNRLK